MRLVSADDVRAADEAAAGLGAPPSRLMEAAGRSVATDLRSAWPLARRPLVLCGSGNNGGDGYVAARHLARAGLRPTVLALRPDGSKGDAAEGARRAWLEMADIGVLDEDALASALRDADVVIDALFGTGLDRPLEGDPERIVARLAGWTGPVLAVDVPSGVDADRAVPPGRHVRADRTVQLAYACPASALSPARFAFGAWTVADIGMPEGALPERERPELTRDADAARAWPTPEPAVHKYDAGTVLIAAGSARWSGAAELACRGAHRGGAGLVTLLTDAVHPDRWPETITLVLDDGAGALSRALATADARHAAARVFGPGLDGSRVPELVYALEHGDAPTVLDAAALDEALRESTARRPGRWLTPHHGEASKLLRSGSDAVHADPIGSARRLAEAWGSGVVLKSAGAVIAGPDGRVRVVAAGHPGMASGGTGDVLAGLLGAALAAPHDDALARVAAAVQLHARAGERAARRYGVGMTASGLADAIPGARKALGGAW